MDNWIHPPLDENTHRRAHRPMLCIHPGFVWTWNHVAGEATILYRSTTTSNYVAAEIRFLTNYYIIGVPG